MKIQFKIALLFSAVCTAIIILLGTAIYYFANEEAFHDFSIRLALRATIAARANLDAEEESAEAYENIRKQHLQILPDEKEYIIKEDTLQRFLAARNKSELPTSFFEELQLNKKAAYRNKFHFYQAIHFKNKTGSYIIIVSAENSYGKDFLATLRNIIFTGCLICMIIVFSIGLVFAYQILLPIRIITREVKNINATSLHKRLIEKKGSDEIADLVNTFNEMISRLEMAFETQHNFVGNASHELNTPLTSIIGEADYALSRNLSEQEYKQSLSSILEQSEKLRDITKGLLELARSHIVENFSMEKIRIDEIIYNVQKIANQVYPHKILTVDYSLYPDDTDKLTVYANSHLLELAISNIVLNACKYSSNKPVTIGLAALDKEVTIIVKDNGIGIPIQDITHIFDPFFRASNVKGTFGYGIGLPLTKNILKIHNSTIHISSKENEGTEVVIKIPFSSR